MGTSWVRRRLIGAIGLMALVVFVAGLLAVGPRQRALAQQQDPTSPNIEFSEPSFTLPPDGEADLRLFNNTTFELTLALRIAPDGPFEIRAGAQRIPPGGSLPVTVSASGAEDGVEGTVVAIASPQGNDRRLAAQVGGVARTSFTLAEPSAEAPGKPEPSQPEVADETAVADEPEAAAPLVSEWSVTSYRFKPWGDDTENVVLPLRDVESCADLGLSTGTVGGVAAAPGAARVQATCTDEGAPGADVGVALSFPGLAQHTGDYSGAIDLAPGESAGAGDGAAPSVVGLTVRRTDYFVLPLAALLLGVLVAIAAVRHVVRRGARAADERQAWLLLARVDEAHQAFRAKAQDAPWSVYSFKPDADRRVRAALGMPSPGASPDAPVAAGANGADGSSGRVHLQQIATAAASWPLLAERLGLLEEAVGELALKAPSHRPPTDGSIEPACLAVARSLLAGRRLDVDAAVERAAAVDSAATLVTGWLGWAGIVSQLESRVELLALTIDDLPEDHPDRQQLADARAKLTAARVGLWEADTLDALEQQDTLVTIGEARALVDGLHHRLADDARANGDDPPEPAELTVPAPIRSSLRTTLERRAPSPAEEPHAGLGQRWWRSGVAPVVTATVVAASGLSVLYAGQAFGTPRDYLAIFVWGLGGQALLGAVTVGFDRVVSGGAGPADA